MDLHFQIFYSKNGNIINNSVRTYDSKLSWFLQNDSVQKKEKSMAEKTEFTEREIAKKSYFKKKRGKTLSQVRSRIYDKDLLFFFFTRKMLVFLNFSTDSAAETSFWRMKTWFFGNFSNSFFACFSSWERKNIDFVTFSGKVTTLLS